MPGAVMPVLQLACVTDPGQVRSHNEDSIAGDPELGFAVLADGMGGHNAGEVASRMATDLVTARIKSEETRGERLAGASLGGLIAADIAAANAAVLAAAQNNPRYRGMGTTLVLVRWYDERVTYGHIGDSRLYLLRGGRLEQLTRDHSIVQEQLDRGAITREQARYAANRNVLTRAIGIDPDVQADIGTRPIRAGDLYLLCSDGLTDMMTDEEIRRTLLTSGSNVASAAARLVEQANEAGGYDNVSVVLVQVASGPH
jgi:protein phosphatase